MTNASAQSTPPTLADAQRARGLDRKAQAAAPAQAGGGAAAAQAAAAQAAPADKPAAKVKPVRKVAHIQPKDAKLEESAFYSFFMTAPADSVPSDFHLNPRPFELLAAKMERFSSVRIVHPLGLWMLDGIVIDQLQPGYAVVHVTNAFNMPPRRSADGEQVPFGYVIRQGAVNEEPWVSERLEADGSKTLMNYGQFHRTRHDCLSHLLLHSAVTGAVTKTDE